MSKKTTFLFVLLLLSTPFAVYYALNVGMPYILRYSQQATEFKKYNPKDDQPEITHLKASRYKINAKDEDEPPPAAEVSHAPKKPLSAANEALLQQARYLYATYNYPAVRDVLAPIAASDPAAAALIAKAQQAEKDLRPFKGEPEHVFFHSLIIDPQKAFHSPMAQGYNYWMTTVSEFKKMLPLLLAKGFVLYPPGMMVEIDSKGNLQRRPIMLPAGKKPLVLSVDDINYYDYMKKDGFASRLVPMPDGRVLTEVNSDGKTTLTDSGDVVPILDNFVAAHPEFSYHGYKGILAITGYEGAFGYRLNELAQFAKLQKPKVRAKMKTHTPEEEAKMIATVRQLVTQLRRNGWDIASHSFTHNSYFRTGKITLAQLKSEVERFNDRISPYVGKPLIFIPPFGMHLNGKDPRYQYLHDAGFLFYMPVASTMRTDLVGGMLRQNRLNLDGFTMMYHPEKAAAVFTPAEIKQILDPARPRLNL